VLAHTNSLVKEYSSNNFVMHGLVYQLLSVEDCFIHIHSFRLLWFVMQVSSDPKIEEETAEEELQFRNEPVCFI